MKWNEFCWTLISVRITTHLLQRMALKKKNCSTAYQTWEFATRLKLGFTFSADNNKKNYFGPLSYVHTIASSTAPPPPTTKRGKSLTLKKPKQYTKPPKTHMPFCIQTTQSNRETPSCSATAVLHRACLKVRRKCRQAGQVPELFALPLAVSPLYISSIVHIILAWGCVKLFGMGIVLL